MKLVHLKLIAYPDKNQQNACEASGQACEVDKEGTLESQEIPVGNEQIMSDHNVTVLGRYGIGTPTYGNSYIIYDFFLYLDSIRVQRSQTTNCTARNTPA